MNIKITLIKQHKLNSGNPIHYNLKINDNGNLW